MWKEAGGFTESKANFCYWKKKKNAKMFKVYLAFYFSFGGGEREIPVIKVK